ncbi:MAG: hypothetical protein LBT07_02055 [Endomicrobium sp.]|jgi:uncharacterized protein YacL|nr:hypothetical protein [Endomicrobium sp.]
MLIYFFGILTVLVFLIILLIKNRNAGCKKAVIDSSILVDGRIYYIIKTKFLLLDLIIPSFVVDELKDFAKSSDQIKRSRSKRGFSTIEKLKKIASVDIEIVKKDFNKISDPVLKIIKFAKAAKTKIITKNFNLYKEASLNGVPVLNINDLEAALYPVLLPGEQLNIYLIKEGMQHQQAVGYFDDKTMVVAENGINFLGKEVVLTITSTIFTSSGKVIFGKVQD